MTDQVAQTVIDEVAKEPGITLATLIDRIPDSSIRSISKQIINGEVYVDLCKHFLGEPEKVRVFTNKTTASFFERLSETQVKDDGEKASVVELIPGTSLIWDGIPLQIIHVGKTEITLQRECKDYVHFPNDDFQRFINDGRVTGFTARPEIKFGTDVYEKAKHIKTEEEMIGALERYEIIRPRLSGKAVATPCHVTPRTVRTWIKQFKAAELKYRNGLLGLVSHIKKRGNTNERLDPRTESFMKYAIEHEYGTAVKKTKTIVYGFFSNLCAAAGILRPPSYKTFIKRIKRLLDVEMTEKRDGSKVAYQIADFLERVDTDVPIHGDRPWEFGHIDHTQLDEEALHSDTGNNMGKPWITLMIDSCTRRVLAYYLTYDPPSYRSLLGVTRECVRKHGRLPENVIVDRGSDLKSVFFEKLWARFQRNVIKRPPTMPRFGAIIERFIYTMNMQVIHNLRGNTKAMKNARQTTKAVNPKNLTVWDLPMLDEALSRYFYEEYDNRVHSALGMTPREAFEKGVAKFGSPTLILYDKSFIMDTLPSTRSGFATIRQQRGIKMFGHNYQANQFRNDQELYGTKVEVRYDPYDMSVVYAYVRKQWIPCLAPPKIFSLLKNRSEREMRIIFEEERQKYRAYGRNFNERAMEMALQQAEREQSEAAAKQRLCDNELRKIALTKDNQHSTVSQTEVPDHPGTSASKKHDDQGSRRASGKPRTFGRAKKAA
jgi:putative transposase